MQLRNTREFVWELNSVLVPHSYLEFLMVSERAGEARAEARSEEMLDPP